MDLTLHFSDASNAQWTRLELTKNKPNNEVYIFETI